ncbi:hypothetical protein [Nocardiopsis rhodophaea]
MKTCHAGGVPGRGIASRRRMGRYGLLIRLSSWLPCRVMLREAKRRALALERR